MNRTWLSALLAVAISSAATLAAQNPQNPPTQRPDAPRPTTQAPQNPSTQPATSANKITVTGCIEKGDQPTDFVLANASIGAAKPDAPSATGTAGSKMKYTLVGKSDELTKHMGHRVEVVGTAAPAAPSSSAAPSAAGAAASAQRLQVESVKMIAAECK
jgi:hypothetical protein